MALVNRIIDDAVLEDLAVDAFDVLNWARRLGMKRDAQIEQVVATFRKTLTAAGVQIKEPTP